MAVGLGFCVCVFFFFASLFLRRKLTMGVKLSMAMCAKTFSPFFSCLRKQTTCSFALLLTYKLSNLEMDVQHPTVVSLF